LPRNDWPELARCGLARCGWARYSGLLRRAGRSALRRQWSAVLRRLNRLCASRAARRRTFVSRGGLLRHVARRGRRLWATIVNADARLRLSWLRLSWLRLS